jgi:tetratricopeptide (TPR) repeat protein
MFIAGGSFLPRPTAQAGELFRPVPSDAQVTRFTRFNIRYTLRDIVADGVEKVEFHITDDMGRSWSLYGEDADRTSPMTISVPGEGVYGFVCVATDRFGNREREPGPRTRPETVIVVDRTPPQARWVEPMQDILARSGQPVTFAWETSDPYLSQGPVRLQFAQNAKSNLDREANWQLLAENQPAAGSYNWTPNEDFSGRYNFRLIVEDRAGNLTIAYNPTTLIIDSSHPRITGVTPLKSNQLENDIWVAADDGPDGSGVKTISLYTSANQGILWELLKENGENGESLPVLRESGQAIRFTAPQPGDYPLWPVVFDKADNASPIPPQGVAGPYILVIDNEPPTVSLSNSFLQGRPAILANETRILEWTSYDPHPKNGSGTVYLSLDNGASWQEIRSGLADTGSAVINFPFGATSEEAVLKIAVEDDFGNTGEGLSQVFKISPANTTITGVAAASGVPDSYFTPTDNSASYSGSGSSTFYEEPGTQPPLIPPPPQTSFPTPETYSSPSLEPTYPTPDYGASPDTGYYQPPIATDPYGAYPPLSQGTPYPSGPDLGFGGGGTTYQPPSATDPYSVYAPPLAGESSYPSYNSPTLNAGDSTAGTFPSAMLNSTQPATGQSLPIPPPPAAVERPDSPASTGITAWNPTPAGSSGALPTQAQAPAFPPPVAETAPLPPPSFADSGIPTPPAEGGLFATPDSDWGNFANAFGDSSMAPPPLPSETSGSQLTDSGGFAAPPITITSPVAPVTPAAPPALATTSPIFDTQPAEVSPIPSLDSGAFDNNLSPPPMAVPERLPTDPRQLSDHYAGEAKNYLDEARPDLAMEAANQAIQADPENPLALARLAQVFVQQEPPDFPRAATIAKQATELGRDWYSWWTCSDIFYRWSHARNRQVQSQLRGGQRPSPDILDERNQALSNAQIAIGNAAKLLQNRPESDREQVVMTQGEITYLQALIVPDPVRPGANAPQTAQDDYRRALESYKALVTPLLLEALPYFQSAMQIGGSPTYREAFHMGIINFRLGGLEKDTGNSQQSIRYYEEASRYLEEATTAALVPAEGPREAYYMLAYCLDQLSEPPGRNRARQREMTLRYWQRTAELYSPGSAYREYAEQRMAALRQELGL